MDSRSDVTTASPTPAGTDPAAAGEATVCCDQAVFTSVSGPTGNGYRLVAASEGVRSEEKPQIVTHSPSHNGLCHPDPGAVGVACYALDSGRYCVAHSCCAGQEGTARGGQRIYTRAVLLDEAAFSRLACNPFRVVRALAAADRLRPDLDLPQVLPPLEFSPRIQPEYAPASDTVGALGEEWLGALLDRVLAGEVLLVVGSPAPQALAEAILLSLPAARRGRLSLAAGLRFSLSRRLALNLTAGDDPAHLRRTIQGHGIELLEPGTGPAPPAGRQSAWSEMARRHWSAGTWHELAAFTARHLPDPSNEGLERYGRLSNLQHDVQGMDAPAALTTLEELLLPPCADPVAAELIVAVVRSGVARLRDLYGTATQEELLGGWDAVVELWATRPRARSPLSPLLAGMLKRLTRLAPLQAAAVAPQATGAARAETADALVGDALEDLLDHLLEWAHDAGPEKIEELVRTLATWPTAHDLAERLQALRNELSILLADRVLCAQPGADP